MKSTKAKTDTAVTEVAREDLKKRIALIEEGYEFMLGYAAQGLPDDREARSGAQLRDHLKHCDTALTDLADLCTRRLLEENDYSADHPPAFTSVLERDARDAQAAIQLVLAQPSISSQLIDNLNASIHVRALLTDLFLVAEILKL